MKKTSFLLGVLAVLLIQGTSYAQDPDAVCAANQRDAQRLLPLTGQVLNKSEEQYIYNLVKPCADAGNTAALCNLAILYKDGIHVKQDFFQSFKLFTQAAEAGDEKAKYALGYMSMKGLGTAQNYTKAIAYYQSSLHPMAHHWYAYCQYFGYGTTKNEEEAIALLDQLTSVNSETVGDQFYNEFHQVPGTPLIDPIPEEFQDIPNFDVTKALSGSSRILSSGRYEGALIEYDWSGLYKIRHIPIRFSVTNKGGGTISAKVNINNQLLEGSVFNDYGYFNFNASTSLALPRNYTDNPNLRSFTHPNFAFGYRDYKENPDFDYIGVFGSQILELNEPVNPYLIVFKKISDEPTGNLDEYIKSFPNPITGNTFNVEYKLTKDYRIRITVVSADFLFSKTLLNGSTQEGKAGVHTLTLSATDIPPGIHFLFLDTGENAYDYKIIKQ